MPAYDVSLWDFLKYASKQKEKHHQEDFFPLSERIEMTKRICEGLLFLSTEKALPHRDMKPRSAYQICISIR